MIRFEESAVIERPVADVFALAADPTNDPLWASAVAEASQTSEGPLGVGTTFEQVLRLLGDGSRSRSRSRSTSQTAGSTSAASASRDACRTRQALPALSSAPASLSGRGWRAAGGGPSRAQRLRPPPSGLLKPLERR